ncbi:hypothetical protein FB451DRAFT_1189634 [Mycena latifolia]|nr:hypothetical protein FB451DRAFT_1189634 [Mycena latifolia]
MWKSLRSGTPSAAVPNARGIPERKTSESPNNKRITADAISSRHRAQCAGAWAKNVVFEPGKQRRRVEAHRSEDHLGNLNDPSLACKFYRVAGTHRDQEDDKARACNHMTKPLCWRGTRSIGDYAEASRHAREAEEKSQMCGNVHVEAAALDRQGTCCSYLGSSKAAIALWQRGRQLLQLCGMSGGSLDHHIMVSQANVHFQKSEYAEARSVFTTITNDTSFNKDPWNHAQSVINITLIDLMTGKPEPDVQSNIEKAKEICTAMCSPVEIDYCRIMLADLKLRERNISDVKELFQAVLNSQWGQDAEGSGSSVYQPKFSLMSSISGSQEPDVGFYMH